ncbi:MAG TPA: carbonic anhydrase [Bacteroides sp.]|nr:carbonic anhydrase [Bacteroides sp.]
MSAVKNELLESNARYSKNFGRKKSLPTLPIKKTAILTCMDARLDPASFSGFVEGDANVIRNAGGRASDDAIRSLIISHKLMGTNQWFVIQHTDCGMMSFTNEVMADLLSESLETAIFDRDEWKNTHRKGGSGEGRKIDWLCISDPRMTIIEDVRRIREHPLVSEKISVFGFLYHVESGMLEELSV